ncbi:MAG: hypothetical protein M1143_03415 [Candidatus Thermoplasmatota archaeon]|nr:hypothetical protein [Candidatus Thermoplasmatota archaeon]
MRSPKTHRIHRRRRLHRSGSRGVASAIAILFILLLIVAGINTYLVTTLPSQMAVLEYQHTLHVESDFVQLQSDILAEANHPNLHVQLDTPISMQSQGIPPFGFPAESLLSANPSTSASANFSYKMGTVSHVPVAWNGPIPTGCSGSNVTWSCSGTSNGVHVYNASGNHTTLSVTVNGCGSSGCVVIYNVSGYYDTINIIFKGNNVGNATVVVEGAHNVINLSYGGSSKSHRYVNMFIYGQYDSYAAAVSGAGSGQNFAGVNINTTFIGWNGGLCPATTLSQTDVFGGVSVGNNAQNVWQNVSWWNNLGYTNSSSPFYMPIPPTNIGNNVSSSNDYQHFENDSGFIACAFTVVSGSGYQQAALSGIFDALDNRYYPRETVGFEEGAVVAGTSAMNSQMVSVPLLSVIKTPYGYDVNITLIQLVLTGNMIRSGGGITSIETHLLGVSEFTYANSPNSLLGKAPFLVNPFYLNITTLYPGAWLSFFKTLSQVIPSSGASATFAPENGYPTWEVVAPLKANGFNVRVITVGVSFL